MILIQSLILHRLKYLNQVSFGPRKFVNQIIRRFSLDKMCTFELFEGHVISPFMTSFKYYNEWKISFLFFTYIILNFKIGYFGYQRKPSQISDNVFKSRNTKTCQCYNEFLENNSSLLPLSCHMKIKRSI